jgi:hypothetical protein
MKPSLLPPSAQAINDLLRKLDAQVNRHLAGVTRRSTPPTPLAAPLSNTPALPAAAARCGSHKTSAGRTWFKPALAALVVSVLCAPAWVVWSSAESPPAPAAVAAALPACPSAKTALGLCPATAR